jgi:glycerophosphoryl diester phosphodiesterase
VEEETADLLRKYNMVEKTVVTSFELEYLKKFRVYAPEFETGYLADEEPLDENLENTLLELGITEICPKVADIASKEMVDRWHKLGFRVRTWGAFDEELMRRVVDWGCDGTTCNFPDKLTAYLKEK